MKKKLLFLVILFAGFILFTVISVFFLKKEHDPELKILSAPNATATLDGKVIGKTPIEGFIISEGEHMLILRAEGTIKDGSGSAEIAPWQGKISAFKNSRTYVDRELGASDITSSGVVFWVHKRDSSAFGQTQSKEMGTIEITTDPIGTIIYLDNDEKGIAPLMMENVPVGEHEISAYSPGFMRRSQKIKVEAGYVVSGEIKLAIDKSYQKVEEPKISTESATLSGTPTPSGSVSPTGEVVPTLKAGMKSVKIKNTPTGFLRVRDKPSTGGAEVGQVNPGDTFVIIAEENGWIKIEYEKGAEGWVSGQYVERM